MNQEKSKDSAFAKASADKQKSKSSLSNLKVALVHDFLTAQGGGERVLQALHQLFPDAPIYTLRYDAEKTHHQWDGADIRVAALGQTWLGKSALLALPFLPNAVERLPLSEYDLVISSSSAFSKGIITRPNTLHICYCHTPMRYAWDWTHEYARENGYDRGLKGIGYRLLTHYLRLWDQASAERVDSWIANSKNVANRIQKYYRKPATVIYPPVDLPDTAKATASEPPTDKPYFLIVSRLSPYKKIDLAIEACTHLNQPLVIIGEGSDRERLETLAQQRQAPVVFLGYQDDATIATYYQHCRAFLFAGEDDFGITPVEAMSYGKPVIAYGKGGVLETILPNKTGLFFDQPTVASLIEALELFAKKEAEFKPDEIKKQAKRFSGSVFVDSMHDAIEKEWQVWHEKH